MQRVLQCTSEPWSTCLSGPVDSSAQLAPSSERGETVYGGEKERVRTEGKREERGGRVRHVIYRLATVEPLIGHLSNKDTFLSPQEQFFNS